MTFKSVLKCVRKDSFKISFHYFFFKINAIMTVFMINKKHKKRKKISNLIFSQVNLFDPVEQKYEVELKIEAFPLNKMFLLQI